MPRPQLALETFLRGLKPERLSVDDFEVAWKADNNDGEQP